MKHLSTFKLFERLDIQFDPSRVNYQVFIDNFADLVHFKFTKYEGDGFVLKFDGSNLKSYKVIEGQRYPVSKVNHE
jgi:hypothetical protein